MKHTWENPIILFQDEPGDDIVIGGGSGQSTTDPFPCTYKEWQTMFEEDYDLDEDIDFDDYGTWWADNGFSLADWNSINPDTPWDPAWGDID